MVRREREGWVRRVHCEMLDEACRQGEVQTT